MFNAKGVKLISLKENFDTSTSMGKLMITVIGAIYEFQRAYILEAQAAQLMNVCRTTAYKKLSEYKKSMSDKDVKDESQSQ